MGLDAVELIIEIEEAFSLEIPDGELSHILTVGDLYDYLKANFSPPSTSATCLSAITFYSLRRAAQSVGVTERVRPRDATTKLLPPTDRRNFWRQFQSVSGLRLPRLQRPRWLTAAATTAVLSTAVVASILLYRQSGSQVIALSVGAISLLGLGLFAVFVTLPSAIHPARNFQTVRGLVETTLGLNFQTLNERYSHQPTDIWVALRAIIAEQLGISPDKITPDSSFVNDLGLG